MIEILFDEFEAISQSFFNIGIVIAGIWALYQYRTQRRTESIRWLEGLFDKFYVDGTFRAGIDHMEYTFDSQVYEILKIRISDRDKFLSDEQKETEQEVDRLFNYFEHLIYMREVGAVKSKDIIVLFEHWFGVFKRPDRAILRRYFANTGYERLAKASGTQDRALLAVTPKMQSTDIFKNMKSSKKITFFGKKSLPMHIDDNDILCFVPKSENQKADLFYIDERSGLKEIDEIFGSRAAGYSKRICISPDNTKKDIWVYCNHSCYDFHSAP